MNEKFQCNQIYNSPVNHNTQPHPLPGLSYLFSISNREEVSYLAAALEVCTTV